PIAPSAQAIRHGITRAATLSVGVRSRIPRYFGLFRTREDAQRGDALFGLAVAAAHRLSRDQVIWSFGPELEPVLEVGPGETVTFETNDCFTGQIRTEDDLVTEIDLERINSATGPVAVEGAEPGDSLVAEILDGRPIEGGGGTLIPGLGRWCAKGG